MSEQESKHRRRMPVASLRGQTPEVTEALRTLLYLRELDRQATMYNNSFEAAWRLSMLPTTAEDDPEVWARLQSALFASIVVQRLLLPIAKQVHKHDHHKTQQESARDRPAPRSWRFSRKVERSRLVCGGAL